MSEKCKNCGHELVKVKALNGWAHWCICEQGWHCCCTYTGDEDQYPECECENPEPKELSKK